jgi:hypothetical protein
MDLAPHREERMRNDPDMLDEYDFSHGIRGKYAGSNVEGGVRVVSAVSSTVARMIESLPEPIQERVLEHLQDYIEDMRDELKWNESFARTQDKLAAAARNARAEIARGSATPLNPDDL